jgi:lauroyl/myristoyl acyltransferase
LLFLLLPSRLARRYLMRLADRCPELQPMRQAARVQIPRLMPDLSAQELEHQILLQSLTRVVDRIDPVRSALFEASTLNRALRVQAEPLPAGPLVILGGHVGNAWWVLPWLRSTGRSVQFVAARLPELKAENAGAGRIARALAFWRWRELKRVCGLPVIEMQGASRHVAQRLEQNGTVVALLDVPSAIAKKTMPVRFFGKTAYLPRRIIEIALEKSASLYFLDCHYDHIALRYELRLSKFSEQHHVERAFQEYSERLEANIRTAPGRWLNWGEVDCFFRPD